MEVRIANHELDYLNIIPEDEYLDIKRICEVYNISHYVDEYCISEDGGLILYINPIPT